MFLNNALFVFILVCWLCSIGESGVATSKKPLRSHMTGGYKDFQMKTNASEFDCSQFTDDYDILRQLPFPIMINPIGDDRYLYTVAIMDKDDIFVDSISIRKENVVPWSVFCLLNLHILEIDETPFENDIVPDALGNLKKLRKLWFYGVPILKMTEQLGTLTNLSMIILRSCSLTYMPNLSNLQQLRALEVSYNRLSYIDGIPDVEFLDLSGNFFNEIPIIKNREKVRFIDMSRNPLKNAAPILFYNNNLEGIYLNNAMLTSIPPAIDKFQELKYLDISANKLSHLPTNILNLPHLEMLNISQNLLSPNDIQSIQKSFRKSHPQIELIT